MIDKDVFVAIAIAGHPKIKAKSQQLYLLRNRAVAKLINEYQSLKQQIDMPDHQEYKPKMTVKKAKVVLEKYLTI